MANPEHLALISQGQKAIEQWRHERSIRQQSEVLDLAGADLRGMDLAGFPLERADLRKADLRGTCLRNANLILAKLHEADLRGTDLQRAQLRAAELLDAELGSLQNRPTNFTHANLADAKLHRANLENAVLVRANLERAELLEANMPKAVLDRARAAGAKFIGADLSGASLRGTKLAYASFQDATLTGSDLFEAQVQKTAFRRAKGLNTARNLTTVYGHAYDFEACDRKWQERYVDWEQISIFGRLRLLGVSYTALALIIFYVYVLEFYNQKVALIQSWTSNVTQNTRGLPPKARNAVQTLAFELQKNLRSEPPPEPAFYLVASFLLLAIASTVYHFRCPEEVKAFNRVHWCYALRHPLIHYWPLCWRDRWLRLLCFSCYVLGATLALWIVVTRIGWVLWYLLTH